MPIINPALPEVEIVEVTYHPAKTIEHSNNTKTHYKAKVTIGLKIGGKLGTYMYYKELDNAYKETEDA